MKAKDILRDIDGCLSHYCTIRPPGKGNGMLHNGPCACIRNPTKMAIIMTRLQAFLREQ